MGSLRLDVFKSRDTSWERDREREREWSVWGAAAVSPADSLRLHEAWTATRLVSVEFSPRSGVSCLPAFFLNLYFFETHWKQRCCGPHSRAVMFLMILRF